LFFKLFQILRACSSIGYLPARSQGASVFKEILIFAPIAQLDRASAFGAGQNQLISLFPPFLYNPL